LVEAHRMKNLGPLPGQSPRVGSLSPPTKSANLAKPIREDVMNLRMVGIALSVSFLAIPAFADDTVKIGYIDPLSGGGASTGELGLKTFQYLADELNAGGGLNGQKVEIVPLDNKTNPQESLIQAQKAADQGIRIITQGNGSSVAAALSDWVTKYNDRNPGKEIIYFNYAAVDPVLTNDKCSYWHFRWDANSDIKMAALTNFMKDRPNIKKVYLIDQDYSFGQAVRKAARAMLGEKRPDVEIVGDEVHPLLKVTDFSPYIAKIKASGADSVITGNWGQDFTLLLKAAADAGLQTDWYTYYGESAGSATAIKQTGLSHHVFQISEGVVNSAPDAAQNWEVAFRAKEGISLFYPRAVNEMRMLAKAAAEAKSNNPKAIADKLEGMTVTAFDSGDATMREDDHQFFQDMYISSFGVLDPGAKFDEEGTGWGWKTVGTIKAKDTVLPTTCKMERP
jgi:branched-chain amino acid transport system substrate-binding protein